MCLHVACVMFVKSTYSYTSELSVSLFLSLPWQQSDYLICLTEGLKLFLRLPQYRMAFIDTHGLES